MFLDYQQKLKDRKAQGLCIACGNDPCSCKSAEGLVTLVLVPLFLQTEKEKETRKSVYVEPKELKKRRNIHRKQQLDKFLLEAQLRTINEMRANKPKVTNKQIRKELRERGLRPKRGLLPNK